MQVAMQDKGGGSGDPKEAHGEGRCLNVPPAPAAQQGRVSTDSPKHVTPALVGRVGKRVVMNRQPQRRGE